VPCVLCALYAVCPVCASVEEVAISVEEVAISVEEVAISVGIPPHLPSTHPSRPALATQQPLDAPASNVGAASPFAPSFAPPSAQAVQAVLAAVPTG